MNAETSLSQKKLAQMRWIVRCKAAEATYAFEMAWIRSIQRIDRLQAPTEAAMHTLPAGLEETPVGWIAANEEWIPVFRLAHLLNSRTENPVDQAHQRIIVLHPSLDFAAGGKPWAVLVDSVSQAIQMPETALHAMPAAVLNPTRRYFQSVLLSEADLALLLDPEQLCPLTARAMGGEEHAARSTPDRAEGRPAGRPANHRERAAAGPGRLITFPVPLEAEGEEDMLFGLSITQVPEILEPVPIYPVPWAPRYVLGLVNWRDQPVPVIDLAARLHDAPADAAAIQKSMERLIIAALGSEPPTWMGFPARAGIDMLRLPIAARPCNLPSLAAPRLIKGAVAVGEHRLAVLDLPGFVS